MPDDIGQHHLNPAGDASAPGAAIVSLTPAAAASELPRAPTSRTAAAPVPVRAALRAPRPGAGADAGARGRPQAPQRTAPESPSTAQSAAQSALDQHWPTTSGAETQAQRIARATGGTLTSAAGSPLQTLEFPFTPATVTADWTPSGARIYRAPAAAAAPAEAAAADSGSDASPSVDSAQDPAGGGAGAAAPPAGGGSHAAASPETDDLYEYIVERLRRDLLMERERMGDLMGDLP